MANINELTPPDGSSDLPVIKRLTDAYILWHGFLDHMPRSSRFTLGTKIDALFCDAIELIILSSHAPREQKSSLLVRASARLDALKFFLRVAWQTKAIDAKKYAVMTPPLAEVGKMLGGWIKQQGRETGTPAR